MTMRASLPVLAGCLALLCVARIPGLEAQDPTTLPAAGAATLQDPDSGDPDLGDLNWISGHWRQEHERAVAEELWLPARGGLMLGLNRSLVAGRERAAFEFLRIEETPEGIFYRASPSGQTPTSFRLVSSSPAKARFANPEHDYPQWIEYRLEGLRLTASIGAATPGPVWTFERLTALD